MRGPLSRFTAIAVGLCGALVAIQAAEALGVRVPRTLVLLAASAAAVVSATVAVRHIAFIWRGPMIIGFRRPEGRLCDSWEATTIRAAAQLRGTLGGAGHLYPRRLVLSSIAWGAASGTCIALVLPEHGAAPVVPVAILVISGGLAMMFPAEPFYYRETAGGCVVAFPVEVCQRMLRAAGSRPVLTPQAIGACPPSEPRAPNGSPVQTGGEAGPEEEAER